MNILVSGNVSSLAVSLAKAFLRERYQVVVVSKDAEHWPAGELPVRVHSVSPTADHFQEIVAAHKFDVVIYLATREEELLQNDRRDAGQYLDGLLNTLELCRKAGIKKIAYISSTEVYGTQEIAAEEVEPHPITPNGLALKTGEQYCMYYSQQYGLSPTVIRVPFTYGPDEKAVFLHDILRSCIDKKKVVFPGDEALVCSFLHAQDVADYLLRWIDEPESGFQVVNLSSADPITFGRLAEVLRVYFSNTAFEFEPGQKVQTRPAEVARAKKSVDWIAQHKLLDELPALIAGLRKEPQPKKSRLDAVRKHLARYPVVLKWIEVFLGALAMHSLSVSTGAVAEFRYVDFRLAYVSLLGAIYGTQVGLAAAGLASLSILLMWSQSSPDWMELIYNVSNWLPFALYLTAGVITGYWHDKKENESQSQEEQIRLLKEKYVSLYELYQEVSQLKNQFYKQLVGSRDSFGRIFNIARQLDTLEEEEVIFKALHVLEDVMDNRTIAIYSVNQASCYARLEIHSSSLVGRLKKSLNLREYPELAESIEKNEIFQNRELKPGYPAYFVPIANDSMVVAGVAVWDASFEQFSLYYVNLLKVICGLIQSSINRVALFMDANIDKFYIPNTRILQPVSFVKVLRVKNKIKMNKLGSHLLVKVVPDHRWSEIQSWEDLSARISAVTRAEDYVGLMEDGNCYILLVQADNTNADAILRRLDQNGIRGEPVTDPNVLALDVPLNVEVGAAAVKEARKQTGLLSNNSYQYTHHSLTGGGVSRGEDRSSVQNATGLPLLQYNTARPNEDHDKIVPDTGQRVDTIKKSPLEQLWQDLTTLRDDGQTDTSD